MAQLAFAAWPVYYLSHQFLGVPGWSKHNVSVGLARRASLGKNKKLESGIMAFWFLEQRPNNWPILNNSSVKDQLVEVIVTRARAIYPLSSKDWLVRISLAGGELPETLELDVDGRMIVAELAQRSFFAPNGFSPDVTYSNEWSIWSPSKMHESLIAKSETLVAPSGEQIREFERVISSELAGESPGGPIVVARRDSGKWSIAFPKKSD